MVADKLPEILENPELPADLSGRRQALVSRMQETMCDFSSAELENMLMAGNARAQRFYKFAVGNRLTSRFWNGLSAVNWLPFNVFRAHCTLLPFLHSLSRLLVQVLPTTTRA